MRRIGLLLVALSFNLSAASPPVESFAETDQSFPDFVFVDPSGKPGKISDYRGKVVLVKLWATWCGVCQRKWPEYQALFDKIKNEPDVQVVTLSVFEDPDKSQRWVDAQGFDVPLYENPITDRGAVPVTDGSYFFIKGTPMTFLIDREGILRLRAVGETQSISESDVRSLI